MADEKIVKMTNAILKVDADANWWETMPQNLKADVETAIKQVEKGQTLTHQQVKKMCPQWFTK